VRAYETEDAARGREMHSQFHLGIYELSGSPWLMRTIPPLWDAAERYRQLSTTLRGTLKERHKEHEHILECCRKRNPEAASTALEEHLRKTMTVVKAEIADQGRTSKDGTET
jgi:GntR family transcriptional regulator, carbon starvation induced regulator